MLMKTPARIDRNIPVDIYDQVLAYQGGVCAICHQPKELYMDIHPVSHLMRGLLCEDCGEIVERLESETQP